MDHSHMAAKQSDRFIFLFYRQAHLLFLLKSGAPFSYRAQSAFGLLAAHKSSEFDEPFYQKPRLLFWQNLFSDIPDTPLHRGLREIVFDAKIARKHASDISIDSSRFLMKSKAQNCSNRIRAQALNSSQLFPIGRDIACMRF